MVESQRLWKEEVKEGCGVCAQINKRDEQARQDQWLL